MSGRAEYVEVQGNGRRLVVTRKAFVAIYAGKGFTIARENVRPPADEPPANADDNTDEDEGFTPPLSNVLRRTVPEIVAWVREGETADEVRRRAVALFQREQEGRERTTLLDGLAQILDGEPEQGSETPGGEGESQGAPSQQAEE